MINVYNYEKFQEDLKLKEQQDKVAEEKDKKKSEKVNK